MFCFYNILKFLFKVQIKTPVVPSSCPGYSLCIFENYIADIEVDGKQVSSVTTVCLVLCVCGYYVCVCVCVCVCVLF